MTCEVAFEFRNGTSSALGGALVFARRVKEPQAATLANVRVVPTGALVAAAQPSLSESHSGRSSLSFLWYDSYKLLF